ncbi:MAG: formylmethanofuran dehydrogenase [Hyphomicrobium sp.]
MMTWMSGGSSSPGAKTTPNFENVPCPFCGILCDDLEIARAGDGLKVLKNGCDKAIAGFERSVASAKAMVGGRETSIDEAVAAATDLVRKSSLPMYGGLGTDVDGIRGVMALAEKSGGVVDHALSEGQYRNFRVLQSTGWFMSTLTETRNRADLIIVVGSDIHKLHPRFFERIVHNEASMLSDAPPKRTIVFLGKGLDTSAATGPRVGEVVTLACPLEGVSDVISALRAVLKGAPLGADEIAGVKVSEISALADRVRKASYGVFVWAPPSLAFPHAEMTVQLVSELVKEINLTSRFACLSLGGNEGAVSAGAVCSWQSGYPLRVSYQTGKPDYDPLRYTIPRMLGAGEGDLLVWVSSFTPDLAPPAAKVPTIVLGTPGIKFASPPDVYIPVGTPGADHAGRIVRCDNVVSLPLRPLRASALPKLTDVLARIELAL